MEGSCLLLRLGLALTGLGLSSSAWPPDVIYGTAWKKDSTYDLVKRALAEGFRALDTANMPLHYNESLVGRALSEALGDPGLGLGREDLWIQTKFTPGACKNQPAELHPFDDTADIDTQVQQSVRSSLEHLGLAYVDALLLHAPLGRPEANLEAWRAMERIRDEGKAREIGVSNFGFDELQALVNSAATPPRIVQNRCLMKDGWDEKVRRFCRERGIRYQGFWLLTGNRFLASHASVRHVAASRGKTAQQVVLQYAIQAMNISALTGTTAPEHMRHDLELGSGGSFQLRPEELALIGEIEAEQQFAADTPVTVSFENLLGDEVRVFWQQPLSGALVPNAVIAVGQQARVNTFHGHVFLAKRGDDLVLRWRADRAAGASQEVRVDGSASAGVRNLGSTPLKVFWQDPNAGTELLQGEVAAGQTLHVRTLLSHDYVVRSPSGAKVHEWRAEVTPNSTGHVFLKEEL